MYKAIKYRIYPSNKHFGHNRFVYNYFLDLKTKLYKEDNKTLYYNDIQNMLPELKQQEETKWLSEVAAQTIHIEKPRKCF